MSPSLTLDNSRKTLLLAASGLLIVAGCMSEPTLSAPTIFDKCEPRSSTDGQLVTVVILPPENPPAHPACVEARMGPEVTRSPDAYRVLADEDRSAVLRLPAGNWTVSATWSRGGACADLAVAEIQVPETQRVELDFRANPSRKVCI